MPCATIHLLVADRLIEDWACSPADAPIDTSSAEHRHAFLHGALAPDMGFIPGVDRFVSELAHYVRPGRLARSLLDEAVDDVERAFAWGWITHVVTDAEIHPIVGRAVGERLFGDRDRRVDAAEDCATHVAVEVGLDIAFLATHPTTPTPPKRPYLDFSNVGQLARALERTYRARWTAPSLVRAHEAAVARTHPWPRMLRALSAGRPGPWGGSERSPSKALGFALRAAAAMAPRQGALRGFLSAWPPRNWVVEEVERSVDEVTDKVDSVARGAEDLPDLNLETGGPAGAGLGHSASDAAAARLEVRGGLCLSRD